MTGLELLAAASAAATVGGTVMQIAGTNQANSAQKAQAASVAAQQEAAGKAEVAAAQRRAFEKDRETELMQSKLQASAAMSGGADDVGVVDLGEKIAARGTYNALAEIYKGETRRDNLFDEAEATRATSRARSQASRIQNAGTILSGINQVGKSLIDSKGFNLNKPG